MAEMLAILLIICNTVAHEPIDTNPATKKINCKNVKKLVDIAKSLGYTELTLTRTRGNIK